MNQDTGSNSTATRPARGGHRGFDPAADVTSQARALLCLLVVWIAYRSLAPFVLVEDLTGYLEQARQAVAQPFVTTGMLKHVGAFFAYGALLAWSLPRGRHTVPWRIIGLIVLSAVAIEIVQTAVPERHSRLGDVFIHVLAASLGTLTALRLDPLVLGAAGRRWMRRATLTAGALSLVAAAGVMWLSGPFGSGLDNWSDDYPLVVGNEATGQRPWEGEIHGVAIFARALRPEDIAALDGAPFSTPEGLALRRDLGALLVLPSAEPPAPPHALQAAAAGPQWRPYPPDAAHRLGTGAWSLTGRGLLRVEGTTSEVGRTLREANAFAVEVLAAPRHLEQHGPARIVSMSLDVAARNFTLAQTGASLVLRVRTPVNQRNGARFAGVWEDAFAAPGPRHLVATYDGRTMRAFANGRELEPPQSLQTMSAALGVRPGWGQPLAAMLFFLPAATCFAAAGFNTTIARRIVLVSVAGLLPLVAASLSMWALHGRPLETALPVLALAAVVVGDRLGRALSRQEAARKPVALTVAGRQGRL